MKRIILCVLSIMALFALCGFTVDVYYDETLNDQERNELLDLYEIESIDESEVSGYITSFDVNQSNGDICISYYEKPFWLISHKAFLCAYDKNGKFKYGFAINTSGVQDVIWQNDKMHIVDNILPYYTIVVDSNGQLEDIYECSYSASDAFDLRTEMIVDGASYRMVPKSENNEYEFIGIEKTDETGKTVTIINCDNISQSRLFFENTKEGFDRFMMIFIPIFFATGLIAVPIIKACIKKKLKKHKTIE